MSIDATVERSDPRACLAAALAMVVALGQPVWAGAGDATPTGDASQDHAKTASATLGEIIVTAQKHEERLQDVPIPVTAIGGASLAENNQGRIQDFYTQVPGLSIAPGPFTGAVIAIRGITTGSGTTPSTVGIMVDGVPYGSSATLIVPDFDPGDLARVEVLRGPQGTLYGASSMGGLIDFVTIDPSFAGLSGRVEAGTSVVKNGDQPGYSFRGSVNLPVSDTLALRVSGFTRQDPGYIDNPVTHVNGINRTVSDGGRIAALWKPSDTLSVKLSALYQQARADGLSEINVTTPGTTPALGDLQQDYLPGLGASKKETQAYSAIVKARFGSIDFTSVSGYDVLTLHDQQDFTASFGSFTQFGVPDTGFSGFGVAGTPLLSSSRTSKYSQEFRLAAPLGSQVDVLGGLFYTHEFTDAAQILQAQDPTSGTIVGQTLFTPFESTYEEYAAFVDVTYHVTDRFEVQFGGRGSKIKQTFNESYYGVYDLCCTPTSPYTQPAEDARSNPVTYLLTPQFRLSPDLMVYARVASGYRAGGANAAGLGVPPSYQPDKTKDYEIGAKGDAFDHALSFDVSLYYIDWVNLQLGLVNPATQIEYAGNAGSARSDGLEVSVETRPADGLKLAGFVVFNDAVLTAALPAGVNLPVGADGARLPYSSRWSGNVSIDQEKALTADVTGFAGATASVVGSRQDIFTTTPERQTLPAYTRVDLRAGARWDLWTGTFYVNNLTDKRGVISGGLGEGTPTRFYEIVPRTIGLSIARTF